MEINSYRLISLSQQPGIDIDSQLHRRLLCPATRKIDKNSFEIGNAKLVAGFLRVRVRTDPSQNCVFMNELCS